MPITTLDPKSALVVVDLQKGLLATPTQAPMADIIGRASELAAVFRRRALPVGVATSNGVESTARQAYDLGFDVTLPLDAMTDVDPHAHDHAATRIFPRIAQTGSTAGVLALLASHGA